VIDAAPIALIEQAGFLVALHPSLPIRSIEDLIAYAKTIRQNSMRVAAPVALRTSPPSCSTRRPAPR
jgi:hypothetical protein